MNKILKFFLLIAFFCIFCTEVDAYCENHNFDEWVIETEPECIYPGYKERECKNCFYFEWETIPATGIHILGNWEVKEAATCSENGEMRRYCEDCSYYEKNTIPATGIHTWTEWKLYSFDEPTCMADGRKERYCTVCYKEDYLTIPKDPNAHDWGYPWTVKPATALKKGVTETECYICHTVKVEKLKKLKAKVTLFDKKKTLKRGKNFNIVIKNYTYGDKISKYKTSNKKVATVNKKGKVTAKKKGTAKITVIMKSGCKATCKITVK